MGEQLSFRSKGMNQMKRYLLAGALAGAFSLPAYAGNVSYDSYSTPDTLGDNDVTTTATGASDTPYSYYTGPVVFQLTGGGTLTAYCVDLNHFLEASGLYTTGILDHNGEGQTISEFDSNRIGNIALLGAAALSGGGLQNDELAAAAQAAIWDIAYDVDGATSTTDNIAIQADIFNLLGETFADRGYALALIPTDGSNQMMVTGFAAGAPEPSTWAMFGIGFAVLGAMGWKKSRTVVA